MSKDGLSAFSLISMANCKDEQNYGLPSLSFGAKLTMSTTNTSCISNCSGHGECVDGVCFCEVEYSGGACDNPNLSYYVTFSTVFYVISAVSLVQLVLCINSEFKRQKSGSIFRGFRITTQKALYFFICIATALRGFYFSRPDNVTIRWSESLMSAYYPVLLSSSSLVVCFWAEVFHLHDVSAEKPGFLSKSFTGFILFNVISYSLLFAELVLLHFSDAPQVKRTLFFSVFNSIYAVLMLVVVIFFLIYGIEVYFKIRGAFIQGATRHANSSQLQQSRFGLISQAVFLSFTIVFIFSDVLGGFWKEKVPVLSRNTHQIMFRIVELAVALWYPCAFWNCIRPETLWILNPRRILKRDSQGLESCASIEEHEADALVNLGTCSNFVASTRSISSKTTRDCWICYDVERSDAGPLIQPCSCKGDVSIVHHECLKQWLMESYTNPENVKCKVCNETYKIERGTLWLPSGLTISHWFQTAAIATCMISAGAGACLMVRLFQHVYVRTISVGCAFLIEYVCLRMLGFNILSAYQRAKFSSIKIVGRSVNNIAGIVHPGELPKVKPTAKDSLESSLVTSVS